MQSPLPIDNTPKCYLFCKYNLNNKKQGVINRRTKILLFFKENYKYVGLLVKNLYYDKNNTNITKKQLICCTVVNLIELLQK